MSFEQANVRDRDMSRRVVYNTETTALIAQNNCFFVLKLESSPYPWNTHNWEYTGLGFPAGVPDIKQPLSKPDTINLLFQNTTNHGGYYHDINSIVVNQDIIVYVLQNSKFASDYIADVLKHEYAHKQFDTSPESNDIINMVDSLQYSTPAFRLKLEEFIQSLNADHGSKDYALAHPDRDRLTTKIGDDFYSLRMVVNELLAHNSTVHTNNTDVVKTAKAAVKELLNCDGVDKIKAFITNINEKFAVDSPYLLDAIKKLAEDVSARGLLQPSSSY